MCYKNLKTVAQHKDREYVTINMYILHNNIYSYNLIDWLVEQMVFTILGCTTEQKLIYIAFVMVIYVL
jgi:hypothetical protein